MTSLHWREPLWLLLAATPFLILALRGLVSRRQAARYADLALQPWVVLPERGARLFSKDGAFVAAWLLFAVACAGPRLPLEIPGETAAPDTTLMLAVDVSRSMSAADTAPNRLRRAQIELEDLLNRATGRRIGIIVFAARAHLYVPPTDDADALRFYLASLDALTPPTLGSRPAAALALALAELRNTAEKSAVVLVTDGDFELGNESLQDAAADLARAKVPLYILGMGSVEGDAIPLASGDWLTHDGRAVISRLDEAALRELADATGGAYSPVRNDDGDWDALYDDGIATRFAPPAAVDDSRIVWRELFAWPLLPGVMLLWYALLPFRVKLKASSAAPLLLLFLLPAPPAEAEEQKAFEHLARGNYEGALAEYKHLAGYDARFGEGVGRYRLKDYAGAVRQFQQAVLATDNDEQRGAALFNLGNSYFQLGDYAAAVAVYRDALLYRPAHAASEYNLAFSQALQQAVEERLQQGETTRSAGSGPQRATPSESLSVGDNASLALDEASAPKTGPLPEPPESGAALDALIARGLAHVRLAAEVARQDAAGGRRPEDVARAQQQMEALQDAQPLLWKRLFEMEEGFASSLDTPREMPGVAPW